MGDDASVLSNGLVSGLGRRGWPQDARSTRRSNGSGRNITTCVLYVYTYWSLVLLIPITVRLLRASVCFGAVKEAGPETYTLSASYSQLGDPKVAVAMPKL